MNYAFYGWENADMGPINDGFRVIRDPRHLYELLCHLWTEETCAPRLRSRWSDDNRTCGQCSITAFLVQDIFGGEVYGIPRPGGGVHCFNIINGKTFDLTSEQFGSEILIYDHMPLQNRETHFAKTEKRERYELLKSRLKEAIRE